MYAQCPECLAIYKLGAGTIALAHGRVRCGSCAVEFDTLATLSDELPPEPVTELHVHVPDKPPLLAVPALRPQAPQRELFVSFDPSAPRRRDPDPDHTLRAVREHSPSFARPRYRRRPPPTGWSWIAAATAMGLALAAQFGWLYRDVLLADDRVRDAAQWVCARVACTVPAIRDNGRIALLARDVRPHPTVPGALVISATLSNQGAFPQPFPTVEITLADPNELRIAMRRFTPDDYVSDGRTMHNGLAPGASTSLSFEVEDPGKNAVAFEFKFL